jgi:excisionase family DNA binding protein
MSRITIDGIEKIGYHSDEGAAASDRLLTIQEVCELLNVSKSYVYRLTSEKKIPHIKLMGHLRFRRQEIDSWVSEQEVRIADKET